MAYDSKPWKDQDVDLWVPEKPEQVLVEDWVPSPGRVKKRGVKITVEKQYRNRRG